MGRGPGGVWQDFRSGACRLWRSGLVAGIGAACHVGANSRRQAGSGQERRTLPQPGSSAGRRPAYQRIHQYLTEALRHALIEPYTALHSDAPKSGAPVSLGVRWKEDIMAEYGEWNRKGATLSDVTAKAEYGVSQDFIVKGIQTGKLEYRQGSVWGNPYLRILRSQLEKYIAEEFGEDYLLKVKDQTELRRVKKEVADLKKRLEGLQERKNELEALGVTRGIAVG